MFKFKTIEMLTIRNIVIETPKDGNIEFNGSMLVFLVAVKALVAVEERDNISRRTKEALAARKAEGVVWGARKGNLKNYELYCPEKLERIYRMRQKGFSTYDIGDAVCF